MKMVEKMVEMFTPEMIAIVIVCLTALTVSTSLMVLMTMASLSRVKKRFLVLSGKCLKLEEEQASLQQVRQTMSNNVSHLVEVDDKIQSIEHRMDEFDHKIAESQNQLTGYESKLKEHDALFGQAGQIMGKETAGFNQAVQRIHILEEEFQGLKVFQRTFEQIRNHILHTLGSTPVERAPQHTLSTEQKAFKEEALIPSEPKIPDMEDLYKSRMPYHYP